MKRRLLAIVGLAIVTIAVVASMASQAYSAGATMDMAEQGCWCHRQERTDGSVLVSLEGLPTTAKSDQTYALTVSVSDAPNALDPATGRLSNQGSATGGFLLVVDVGSLASTDELTARVKGMELKGGAQTQTKEGSAVRSWKVTWSPGENSSRQPEATFRLLGLVGNGNQAADNGQPDLRNGDEWATATAKLPVEWVPKPTPASSPTPTAVQRSPSLTAFAAVGVLAAAVIAMRRRGP